MPIRKTQEQFISDAIKVHGDKYDYSKVNYINNRTKVLIGCAIHVDFEQEPDSHLAGRGCRQCANIRLNEKRKMGNTEFIKKSLEIHGNKYDYSKVEYHNTDTKVSIICHEKDKFGNEHGEFKVTPHHHLNGVGCPKCSGNYRHTTNDIIKLFRCVHKDDYDYSKVIYKTTHEKVCIICQKHGEFWQSPDAHLQGQGCLFCKETRHHSEFRVYDAIKQIYPTAQHHYRPDFLKTKRNGRQEIDIYIPEYNIGIEYQGIQHFKPNKGMGGEKAYKNIIKLDKAKLQKCNKYGVKLYYISFEENLPEKYLGKIYTNIDELISEIQKQNKI